MEEPVARWINPDLLEETCEDSVCALCFGVMLEPASGSGHVWHSFCRPCYVKALHERMQCPTCLHPVSGVMVRHRQLEGMLLQLRLRCEHTECEWRGCVGQLAAHLEECEWEPANCLNAGCTDSPRPKDVFEHEATCCPGLMIDCPNEGCSEQHERGSMHVHEEGCDARLLREDMDAHAEATHLDSAVELLQSEWSQNFALEGSSTELERESSTEESAKCRVHITLSILDKYDKILREVNELGTAAAPSCAFSFTPTAEEKARSVRADGSIRLRADVRLFLD